jgi:OOP family OmpA-OmpF porin
MRSEMEQSLSTLRKYDIYGIHYDFDKATMRPESAALIKDIALTLTNNPTWTLQINGHTDSIGEKLPIIKNSPQHAPGLWRMP